MGNDERPERRLGWWNQERLWADRGLLVHIPSLSREWTAQEVLEIAQEFGEEYVVCPESGGLAVWREDLAPSS